MLATGSAAAGALRFHARGRIVLAARQPTAYLVALAQPGTRVCAVDRLDGELLGVTLDELRRHEIVVVTHDATVSNHDLRRIVGDWWDRDTMTTRRGQSLRQIVCLHRGDPGQILRAMGESFYTLAVVRSSDVPEALRHVRPGAQLAIVEPEGWAVKWARDSGYRELERVDEVLFLQ